MINHTMIGTNDIDKARTFYTKALGAIGYGEPVTNEEKGVTRIFFMKPGGLFAVTQPLNGEPATVANGMTIGFKCDSPEQVKAFHDAAIAAGGTTLEDPPGKRDTSMGEMHLCYFRDLDGHKICGIHRPG